MHEQYSPLNPELDISVIAKKIQTTLYKQDLETATKLSRQLLVEFVRENLENNSQIPANERKDKIKNAKSLKLFNSVSNFYHFLEKINGPQPSNIKFSLALATISTAGFSTNVLPQEKHRAKIPVVCLTKMGRMSHELSVVSSLSSYSELMIEELKHTADRMCDLVNEEDVKKSKVLSKISLVGQTIFIFGLIQHKFNPELIPISKNTALGLIALGLMISLISYAKYEQLPHEKSAKKLAKKHAGQSIMND